jgi:hypothetical protein
MEPKIGLARENPIDGTDLSLIRNVKSVKPPLDPCIVDEAAESIENKRDRAWFDVTRFETHEPHHDDEAYAHCRGSDASSA